MTQCTDRLRRFKEVLRFHGEHQQLRSTRGSRVISRARAQPARFRSASGIAFDDNGGRWVDHFAADRARKDRHAEVATTHESDVGRVAVIFTHSAKPIGARDPLRSPHVFCRPDP